MNRVVYTYSYEKYNSISVSIASNIIIILDIALRLYKKVNSFITQK